MKMHEIQYSLQINVLNEIWRNTTDWKEITEFYILYKANVRKDMDGKYRNWNIIVSIDIMFLIITQDQQ